MSRFNKPTFLVSFEPIIEDAYQKLYGRYKCEKTRYGIHYFEADSLFSVVDRIERDQNGQIFIFCIWNAATNSWDTTTSAQLRDLKKEDYYVKEIQDQNL